MKRYRCYMCDQDKAPTFFEFESDGPKCPKCGFEGSPAVVQLRNVHYLAEMAGGPIMSSGKRWIIACKPERPNTMNIAATGLPQAVTCPACKLTDTYIHGIILFDNLEDD